MFINISVLIKFLNKFVFIIFTMVEEEFNEVTEMDLIYESHDRIDALITLLIKKGVFVAEEYEAQLEALYEAAELENN